MIRSGNPALKESTFLDLGSGAVVSRDAGAMTLNAPQRAGTSDFRKKKRPAVPGASGLVGCQGFEPWTY